MILFPPSLKHWDYRLTLPYLVFQVTILRGRKGTETFMQKGNGHAKVVRWELRGRSRGLEVTVTLFTCLFARMRSPLRLFWAGNNASSLVLIKLLLLTNRPLAPVVFMQTKNTDSKINNELNLIFPLRLLNGNVLDPLNLEKAHYICPKNKQKSNSDRICSTLFCIYNLHSNYNNIFFLIFLPILLPTPLLHKSLSHIHEVLFLRPIMFNQVCDHGLGTIHWNLVSFLWVLN